MKLYHTTDAAAEILAGGFRDSVGNYMFVGLDEPLRGVFLALRPADVNDGAKGDQVLEVTFPYDVDLEPFEIVEDGSPAREFIVPAELINHRASVHLLTEAEVEEAETAIRVVRDKNGLVIHCSQEERERMERAADSFGLSPQDFLLMAIKGDISARAFEMGLEVPDWPD